MMMKESKDKNDFLRQRKVYNEALRNTNEIKNDKDKQKTPAIT